MSLKNMVVTVKCDECSDTITIFIDDTVTPKEIHNNLLKKGWDLDPAGDCEEYHY